MAQDLKDDRPYIIFDPDSIEVWELMELEQQKVNSMIMIFCRHLANGNGLVSPDLPNDPLDELTKEQITEIRTSKAYKMLRHFSVRQLNQAANRFVQGMQEFDPN